MRRGFDNSLAEPLGSQQLQSLLDRLLVPFLKRFGYFPVAQGEGEDHEVFSECPGLGRRVPLQAHEDLELSVRKLFQEKIALPYAVHASSGIVAERKDSCEHTIADRPAGRSFGLEACRSPITSPGFGHPQPFGGVQSHRTWSSTVVCHNPIVRVTSWRSSRAP